MADSIKRVGAMWHRDPHRPGERLPGGRAMRGYALTIFNPNDCAEDTTLRTPDGSWAFRNTRLYPAYPGYDWGILAGWAWGAYRFAGPRRSETLDIMQKKYPNWFSPHLHEFWGHREKLPFDEHSFLALAAPCPVIALEGPPYWTSSTNISAANPSSAPPAVSPRRADFQSAMPAFKPAYPRAAGNPRP